MRVIQSRLRWQKVGVYAIFGVMLLPGVYVADSRGMRITAGVTVLVIVLLAIAELRVRVAVKADEVLVANTVRRYRVERSDIAAVEIVRKPAWGTTGCLRTKGGDEIPIGAIRPGARPGTELYDEGMEHLNQLRSLLDLPHVLVVEETKGLLSLRFKSVYWGLVFGLGVIAVTALVLGGEAAERIGWFVLPASAVAGRLLDRWAQRQLDESRRRRSQ